MSSTSRPLQGGKLTLEDLGFSAWHRDRLAAPGADETRLARITAVDRDRFLISGPLGSVPAEATGKLLYAAATPEDLPCVGDWVLVDYLDDAEHAVIHELLPRRTILRRRAAGERSEYQPIAANVDVAYVVQSCDVDFSLNRLDRYLVMALDGGITPILLLTKCDLVDQATVARLVEAVRTDHRLEVVPISNVTDAGYDGFLRTMRKGGTHCLIGSSGVGKSTILNRLLGTEAFATAPARAKSGKGRHTTTRRQLVVLENGALFVDTPGMRELGVMATGGGLEDGFQDIAAAAAECRFSDCTHTAETGCALLARLNAGQLSEERYRSYLKLLSESQHYEMTYLERRKKDRAFGKMVQNYHKTHGER